MAWTKPHLRSGSFDIESVFNVVSPRERTVQELADELAMLAGKEWSDIYIAMTAGRTVISQSVHWCTPRKYVDAVRETFGGTIYLDPCSNRWSIVGAEVNYMLPDQDGLRASWDFPSVFVNPPYGADKSRRTTIRNWLYMCAHAHDEYRAEVLALIPVATNTRHWKDYVWGRAAMACFLYDTRLRFLVEGRDAGKGAPMSCAMIHWGERVASFERVFGAFGAVVDIRSLHRKVGVARGARLDFGEPCGRGTAFGTSGIVSPLSDRGRSDR